MNEDVEAKKAAIIDAVCRSELTIEEGEAAARRSGVGSLESWPPRAKHDPRTEPYWSFPSALVWIGTRNFDRVKIWADEYLPAYFEQGNEGIVYHSCTPVNLLSLSHEIDLPACFNLLKNAAAAGKIETTGKPDHGGNRTKIDGFRWADLSYFGDLEGGIFVRSADSEGRITGGGFDDVLVKSDGLIAVFPERLHIGEAWHRWASEFDAELLNPNKYRPGSFGIFKRDGATIPPRDYDESEYASNLPGGARINFEMKVRALPAFTLEGAESSPGQWSFVDGGFDRVVVRDDARDDGGPLSWPGLKIKPYTGDVWLNRADFEALVQSERERRNPKIRISGVPTEAEIETLLKNKFADKLPSRDRCYRSVCESYPGTLRKMVDPVHKKLRGDRGKGRPKKLPE